MKNLFLPGLVAGGAALFAAPGFAQSAVTISGVADAAVRRVENGGVGSANSLVSGSNATSRLIVRGTETIDSDLSAGFYLEHGIALDTGSPASSTQFWDRRATVSLQSQRWGELRAGRDFVPSYVNWSRYDPFSYVGAAGSNTFVSAARDGPIRSAFGSNPNTTVRSSNAVQWLLPGDWGGLEGGLMVAAGEGGTAANGQHKVLGLRLGWAGGPAGVSAATTRSENDLTAGSRFTDTALGGHYDFGVLKLSAALRQFKHLQAKQTNLLIGVVAPLGPGEVKVSYHRVNLGGAVGGVSIDADDAQLFGLGYVYKLSRRSALYGTVSRVANDGAAAYAVPGGPSGMAGGEASTGIEFGLRHTF